MHFLYVLPSNSGRVFSASKKTFLAFFFFISSHLSVWFFASSARLSSVCAETSLPFASINNLEGAMYIYAEACWGDFSRRDVGTKTSRWLHFLQADIFKVAYNVRWQLEIGFYGINWDLCVRESSVCWVELGLNGFDVRRNRLNGSPQCASEQWFRERGRHASRDYRLCDTRKQKASILCCEAAILTLLKDAFQGKVLSDVGTSRPDRISVMHWVMLLPLMEVYDVSAKPSLVYNFFCNHHSMVVCGLHKHKLSGKIHFFIHHNFISFLLQWFFMKE